MWVPREEKNSKCGLGAIVAYAGMKGHPLGISSMGDLIAP